MKKKLELEYLIRDRNLIMETKFDIKINRMLVSALLLNQNGEIHKVKLVLEVLLWKYLRIFNTFLKPKTIYKMNDRVQSILLNRIETETETKKRLSTFYRNYFKMNFKYIFKVWDY